MANPQDPEPIQIGAKATQSVPCEQCQQEIPAGEYYSYKGQQGQDIFLCAQCRGRVESALDQETRNPHLLGAILLGLLGGLAAGIIWYFIVVITHYEIGYLGIGAGYLMGWAVCLGSGHKRGFSLQILSAALTLTTLLAAKYFTFLHFLRQYLLEQKVEGYAGQFFFISPFDPHFLRNLVSPIGLLIWAISLYVAFSVPKPRSL